MPSKSFADYACSNFAILNFVLTYFMAFSLPVKTSANYVLRCCGPESDFTCVNHLDWEFNIASKIVVNVFLNNKETAGGYCPQGNCSWFFK